VRQRHGTHEYLATGHADVYWLRRALRYFTDGRHEASYDSDASGIDSMVIEPGGQTGGR
jgi:hypothetical protein